MVVFLMMVVSVTALEECQREQDVSNIPCMIVSTYTPSDGCSGTLHIYNESAQWVKAIVWGTYYRYCNSTFNITTPGTYLYNSSIEAGIITVSGDEKLIAFAVILIPIFMGLFFLIGSFTLSEQHAAFKIFLFLLSMGTFFTSLHFAMLNVVKFMDFPDMQNLIGSTTYWFGMIFVVIVTYFIIYLFYLLVHEAAQKRKEKLEY